MAKKDRKQKKRRQGQGGFLRSALLVGGGVLLVLLIVVMLLGNFFDQPLLDKPGEVISNIMTPVQKGVSRSGGSSHLH